MSPESITKATRKFFDFRSWLIGMYLSVVRAGTAAILATVGTNAAETLMPTLMSGDGMNWRQAVAAFVSVVFIETVRYINANPIPAVIERPVSKAPFLPASGPPAPKP